MNAVMWVAAGGALGAVGRFGFNSAVTRTLGDAFPWGILLVNILGCFFMGLISAYLIAKHPSQDDIRLFLTTGILGGFTTFSAFAYDTLRMLQSGHNTSAVLYVFASIIGSMVAVFGGLALTRILT